MTKHSNTTERSRQAETRDDAGIRAERSARRSPWTILTGAFVATAVAGSAMPARAMDVAERPAVPPSHDKHDPAADDAIYSFDIAAGPLDTVVAAYRRVTGINVRLGIADLGSLPSPGAKGRFTAAQALEQILAGTGVGAKFLGTDTVVLDLRAGDESVDVTSRVGLSSPKYTAPLRDIPRTITVIPEAVIQSTGSATLVEALRTVPGITFGAGEGGNPVGDRPFIRGSDTQSSTYVDGLRDIGSQSREVFDLESIEVSKGPSGAFGGRGSAGGNINLGSKMAKMGNFVSGSVTPGTANYVRGTIDANHMLSDSMAVRLNVMGHDADIPGRDVAHNSRWGVAPSFSLGLGKPTRMTASYYHLQTNDIPDTGLPYNNPVFVARTDGATRVLPTGDGSPLEVVDRRTFYGLKDRDFRKETANTGTVRLEHDFNQRLTLRNLTRYGKTTQDYISTQPDDSKGNIYYGILFRRNLNRNTAVESAINQTDLFGTFQTAGVHHTFSTGTEFSREQGRNDSYAMATGSNVCATGEGAASGYNCTDLFHPDADDPWAGAPVLNNNPSNSTAVTKSAYVFDTLDLHPKWQATLGLRLDDYGADFLSARAAGTDVRTAFHRDDALVNYQTGVTFKPTAKGSVYASFGTSSQPVGNALAQGSDTSALNSAINENLAPERNRSFEVGSKWDVFGTRALATGAYFHNTTDNARITLQDGSIANAGKRRIDGIELGLSGKITDKWQAFGGYTFLDSELVANGGSGAAFGAQDGAQFPNTPKNSVSVWSTYNVLPNLDAGGGIFYVSKVWGSEPNNKWVPSYVRVDAMATFRLNPHVHLQLNIQNLTNELYFDQAYQTHYASVAPGRSARLTLNTTF
jgi:catecholate siderophore receptor